MLFFYWLIIFICYCFRVWSFHFKNCFGGFWVEKVGESERRGFLPPYCGAIQSTKPYIFYKNLGEVCQSSPVAGGFLFFYFSGFSS